MTQLVFNAEWRGEPGAGINPGSEEVTISFRYGQPLDEDTIEYWREVTADFYDGAQVELIRIQNQT